jgi:hypothetical protein
MLMTSCLGDLGVPVIGRPVWAARRQFEKLSEAGPAASTTNGIIITTIQKRQSRDHDETTEERQFLSFPTSPRSKMKCPATFN